MGFIKRYSDNPTPEEVAAAKEDLRRVDHYIRGVRWDLLIASLICGLFHVGEWIAMHNLPTGTLFDLRPSTGVAVKRLLFETIGITLFVAAYGFGAVFGPKWLQVALRFVLVGILVVFLSLTKLDRSLAAVQSGTSFTFIRTWPTGNVTIAKNKLPRVSLRQTPHAVWLTLYEKTTIGLKDEMVEMVAVAPEDSSARANLDKLVAELGKHRQVEKE